MVALSVIVPTVGRDTLLNTLVSVLNQLRDGDEVIVCADMNNYRRDDHLTRVVRRWGGPGSAVFGGCCDYRSRFGNAQRDATIRRATGTHLLFLDDDDIYQEGALAAFRHAATQEPDAAHVFRARWGPGHHAHGVELWADPVWREQNVATPMVCLPRGNRLPRWMDYNHLGVVSDFGWLTAATDGLERVFHEQVVATVRPLAAR